MKRAAISVAFCSPWSPTAQLITLADYERAAEAVLEPAAFGYGAGGAGDEITLSDNVAAWRRLAIRPACSSASGSATRR